VICNAISLAVQTPLKRSYSALIGGDGPLDDVSSSCQLHQSLVDAGLINLHGMTSISKEKQQSIFTFSNTRLELVRRDDVLGHCGKGKIIGDPDWIDPEVIRGFLDNCKTRHGDLCESYPFGKDFSTSRPAYLIDTEARCIVDATRGAADEDYVMLSYVRGSSNDYFATTKATLAALQEPDAFSKPEIASRIPRTFRDAMHLAQFFGVRYLWIDLLCIVQDDTSHQESEMAKANFICASAVFVIAAYDGQDAHHGLRGLRFLPDAQPRSFLQQVLPVGGGEVFVRSTGARRPLFGEPCIAGQTGAEYPFRAWTFAETVFARRILRFEIGTVRWRCHSYAPWEGDARGDHHMWEDNAHFCDRKRWRCQMDFPREVDEDDDDSDDLDYDSDAEGTSKPKDPHWTYTLAKSYPNIKKYYDAITELSEMRVSAPEDMLNVSAGIQTAFSLHFEGQFICGLPESCFDLALLWGIRARLKQPAYDSDSRPTFPSWSWAGWTGLALGEFVWELDRVPEINGADHVVGIQCRAVEIIPTVDWYTGDRPDLPITERRSIQCRRWFEARETFRDSNHPLPPGWSRSQRRLDPLLTPPRGHDPTIIYSHDSAPDKFFWYPIPIRDLTADPSQPSQIRPRYLFASVEHCRLYILRSDQPAETDDRFVQRVVEHGSWKGTQVLRDETGKIAGVLNAHRPDHYEFFHGDEAPARAMVEVVAISRGQVLQNMGDYPECCAREGWCSLYNKDWYEFYNVMWIEWADDASGISVASRRGLGRVYRDVWERQQSKARIDIVLG